MRAADTDRSTLLEAAILVGDQLLSTSRTSSHGRFWSSLQPRISAGQQELVPGVSPTIYGGVGGIVYFLARLAARTGERRFREAAAEGLSWLDHMEAVAEQRASSFLVGTTGTLFLLARSANLLDESIWSDKARRLSQGLEHRLSVAGNEYLAGRAGMAIGLAHVWSVTEDNLVSDVVSKLLVEITQAARLTAEGAYWDRAATAAHPLLGMAHGVAGVTFCLAEFSHCSQSTALGWLAVQGAAYENACFSEVDGEWPDFRRDANLECPAEDLRGALELARKPHWMTAWCHGAPGIGLSRLSLTKVVGSEQVHGDLARALSAIDRSLPRYWKSRRLGLCHGVAGHADCLISLAGRQGQEWEAERRGHIESPALRLTLQPPLNPVEAQANRTQSQMQARAGNRGVEIALSLARWRLDGGRMEPEAPCAAGMEDTSLFKGSAGLGYLFLRAENPDGESILAPQLTSIDTHREILSSTCRHSIGTCVSELMHFGRQLQDLQSRRAGAKVGAGSASRSRCSDFIVKLESNSEPRRIALAAALWDSDCPFNDREVWLVEQHRAREATRVLRRDNWRGITLNMSNFVGLLQFSGQVPEVLLQRRSDGVVVHRAGDLTRKLLINVMEVPMSADELVSLISGDPGYRESDGRALESLVISQVTSLLLGGLLWFENPDLAPGEAAGLP